MSIFKRKQQEQESSNRPLKVKVFLKDPCDVVLCTMWEGNFGVDIRPWAMIVRGWDMAHVFPRDRLERVELMVVNEEKKKKEPKKSRGSTIDYLKKKRVEEWEEINRRGKK